MAPETLLEYRVRTNEEALRALRKELGEHYLDRNELAVNYLPRHERDRDRREWPLILATLVMAATSLANFFHIHLG